MSLFIEQRIQVTEFCEKGYQQINLVTYSLVQRFCHFKVLLMTFKSEIKLTVAFNMQIFVSKMVAGLDFDQKTPMWVVN